MNRRIILRIWLSGVAGMLVMPAVSGAETNVAASTAGIDTNSSVADEVAVEQNETDVEPVAETDAVKSEDSGEIKMIDPPGWALPERRKKYADLKEIKKLEELEERSFYSRFVKGRFWVGARISSFKLKETERPNDPAQELTFLGHLTTLFDEQESVPRVTAGFWLCPYIGFEVTHDRVAAETFNSARDGSLGPSDGVVVMSGPIYNAFLQVPLYDRIFPYVGIGYAPWKTKFEHAPWWNLGWGSPESYAMAGDPEKNTGKVREMVVEDDSSRVLTMGVSLRLTEHLNLDFMMRRMDLLSKAEFYTQLGPNRALTRTGEFPLSHKAFGVGLSLVF